MLCSQLALLVQRGEAAACRCFEMQKFMPARQGKGITKERGLERRTKVLWRGTHKKKREGSGRKWKEKCLPGVMNTARSSVRNKVESMLRQKTKHNSIVGAVETVLYMRNTLSAMTFFHGLVHDEIKIFARMKPFFREISRYFQSQREESPCQEALCRSFPTMGEGHLDPDWHCYSQGTLPLYSS